MKNLEITRKERNTTTTWVFPERTATAEEKAMLRGRMCEIGVRTIFSNFCYSFGGKNYIQQHGGPIGARVTMSAARMVMQDWAEQYHQILLNIGLKVWLFAGYVDDGRQGTSNIRMGTRFQEEKKVFEWRQEWEDEDKLENTTNTARVSKLCNKAMNSINPDLQFTVETSEDFKEKRLPSLDFYMWVEDGQIKHSYFEKPMKTQLVIMKRSAMSENQKMDILSNELIRRLSNIGPGIERQEVCNIIDKYTKQLKNSEYDRKQAKEIITCGLRGHKNKIERRKQDGEAFYRAASDTLEARTRKKLTEKNNWFRKKKKKEIGKLRRDKRREGENHSQRDKNEKEQNGGGAKAVIFVPYTIGSLLAKEMREKENELEKLTGYRLKIVEKVGDPLERMIVKNNPWSGQDCDRDGCLLCTTKVKTGKNLDQRCSKRSAVYETWCES
jgi:hypothetical protein